MEDLIMKITRASSFYRPYYVLVNHKWYKVNKMNFYENDSILVSSNSSWLENRNGGDITELELPVDEIKLKRKEKFDGTVFIISQGKESYSNDVLADLYIPAEMLNIHFVKHEIAFKTQVRAIYQGEQDIYISQYVKSLDTELMAIRDEYEKLHKNISDYHLGYHTENILSDIDKLKELAEKYLAEKQRVENLTIDDIEI
jgi:hypothetical protein